MIQAVTSAVLFMVLKMAFSLYFAENMKDQGPNSGEKNHVASTSADER